MCAYLLDRPTRSNERAFFVCLFVRLISFVRSNKDIIQFFFLFSLQLHKKKTLAFMFYGWNHPIESCCCCCCCDCICALSPLFFIPLSLLMVVRCWLLNWNIRSIIWNCFGPKRSKWILGAQIKSNGMQWHPTWWLGTIRLRIELCQDSVKCS